MLACSALRAAPNQKWSTGLNTEKKASHKMFTFVGVIFAIGIVVAGLYFTVLKPGSPDGQNITPPSGQSNQPSH